MNTILVFGTNGFIGHHFIDYVKNNTKDKTFGFSKGRNLAKGIDYFQGSS